MKKVKNIWPWAAIVVVVIIGLVGGSGRTTSAQSASGSDSAVASKLDEVLRGQREILDGIAAIKEELKIIKIRVTQQQ